MDEKMTKVAEKANEVKITAKKTAKYVGVAAAGACVGAGIMWMVTHGQVDKVAAVTTTVVDAAKDVVPEVVEAAV